MSSRGMEGNGLGKGGAKLHRKLLRPTIQGITQSAVRRMARCGGVKRKCVLIYEETRCVLAVLLANAITDQGRTVGSFNLRLQFRIHNFSVYRLRLWQLETLWIRLLIFSSQKSDSDIPLTLLTCYVLDVWKLLVLLKSIRAYNLLRTPGPRSVFKKSHYIADDPQRHIQEAVKSRSIATWSAIWGSVEHGCMLHVA